MSMLINSIYKPIRSDQPFGCSVLTKFCVITTFQIFIHEKSGDCPIRRKFDTHIGKELWHAYKKFCGTAPIGGAINFKS